MEEYHKILTIYKRNPETKYRTLLEGNFALPEFEYLKDNEWVFTEKIDGTNIRVMLGIGTTLDDLTITFDGKSEKSQIPVFLNDRLQEIFLPKLDVLKQLFSDKEDWPFPACLYGEGYGAKIQKDGGNYSATQDFVLFDIRVGEWWLKRDVVEQIAVQLNLEVTPEIGRGGLVKMVALAREGFKSRWGDFQAEGIVARPAVELRARDGKRIITKIKYKDFKI